MIRRCVLVAMLILVLLILNRAALVAIDQAGEMQTRSGDLKIAFPRAKRLQKRIALRREPLLQFPRAITVATGPRLCSVLMSAIAPRMRVLHTEQLEILFPIRTLFRERRIAKAGLNPRGDALSAHTILLHIVQVFVPCN